MTIEQVKEEAKKRFDKDLTGEQAQAWLEAHSAGELREEDLENITGGINLWDAAPGLPLERCPWCGCTEFFRNVMASDTKIRVDICKSCSYIRSYIFPGDEDQ